MRSGIAVEVKNSFREIVVVSLVLYFMQRDKTVLITCKGGTIIFLLVSISIPSGNGSIFTYDLSKQWKGVLVCFLRSWLL